MELSLANLKWEIKGYWPFVPLKEKSMETGQTLHGVTPWIAAKVPGGVHYDLWKAGLIENPYFGLNSLNCEWVENRWWMYRTELKGIFQGIDLKEENVTLIFKGLDYEAVVFFNDKLMGEHKGMYEPLEIPVSGEIQENNKLVVLFKGVPQEMGQIGYTSATSTQKSRFNYKWDFSTHLINIGFWQDVVLRVEEKARLTDCSVETDVADGLGKIQIKAKIAVEKKAPLKIRIKVTGAKEETLYDVKILKEIGGIKSTFFLQQELVWEETIKDTEFSKEILIENPSLWYPNGHGEQPLYQVSLELLEGEEILSSKQWEVGIRSLEFGHNEREHEGASTYTFIINGRKIYIKGVNITPLDHIYGNVSTEQYEHLVTAMVNAGVNLVRVWGGGLIEKEIFYDLCDRNGILVWQEFIQSSSGIDNRPCEDKDFLELLKRNAIAAVKEKRNHTALTVYSGGNELMEKENTPVSLENKNVSMLEKIVRLYDGKRLFLPTSASGPREFISREKGVSHDVHGNWRYEGNPAHYELYGESDNLFHSEFGMDGTSSVKSLRKFLPKDALYPTPMSGDARWQHHGEWWGTYFRDCEIFGTIEKKKEELETFVKCSQYMQAEGLRFIIEADRRRAFQNSGVIIWQLNEPWPNASCTNLMDYYGETKPAYYQVKKTFETLHVSLDYRSLNEEKGTMVEYPVYLSNSGFKMVVEVEAVLRNAAGEKLQEISRQIEVPENGTILADKLNVCVPSTCEIYFITVKVVSETKVLSENTYLFSTRKQEILAPLRTCSSELIIEEERETVLENGRIQKRIRLKNIGKEVAVNAGAEILEDGYWMLGNENYVTLFPEESRWMDFLLIPKKAGTFLEEETGGTGRTLRIFCI